jgi:CxxC-x17-CxxC domain-containing protein
MGNYDRNDRGGGGRYQRRDFGGNRGGGDRSRGGRNRQMFKTTCSNCGKACEVPFRPTNTKPVYCSDCFEKMGGRNGGQRRDDRRPQRDNRGGSGFSEQFADLTRKLDKIISLLEPKAQKEQTPQVPQPVEEEVKQVKAELVQAPKPIREVVKVEAAKKEEVTKKSAPKKKASKTKK